MKDLCASEDDELTDATRHHHFPIMWDDLRDIARHFYDLGCRRTAEKYDEIEYNRQRAEESEKLMNLDEEINRYLHEECSDDDEPGIHEIAEHFAQWGVEHTPLPEDTVLFNKGVEEGKRLMMKEAVETEVTETCGISSVWVKTKQFKPGQKVRIIIIKEDEK